MQKRFPIAVAIVMALFLAAADMLLAVESCGPPPAAKPQRRTGGESFPPLPLPATPLRRTEKKRQPSPPTLIDKVAYGSVTTARQGAKEGPYSDWKTDPGDVETLLEWVNGQLGINYGSKETTFKDFSYDPSEVPVLYLTGHNPPSVTADEARRLRAYLQDGGYLIADACCGSRDFQDAFEKMMGMVFPDVRLRDLGPDHPLFSDFNSITEVAYQNAGKAGGAPVVKGIDIGCRTAVFYFPRDVSCGWSGHSHPTGERFSPDDARKLGANLVTYIVADYQLGRYLSSAKIYYQSGEKTRDEFVFGQVVHNGGWDPSPSGTANLLEYVDKSSSIHVQYKKAAVDPNSKDVFNYPFLYMTGHYDFSLSDAAVANLRRFLDNGGILLGESCCGSKEFDAAFRREMAKVFPGQSLELVPPDSPVYNSFYQVTSVGYSEYARAAIGALDKPALEQMALDGRPAVIYSPLALANGWEQFDHPYSKGYDTVSSLKLGMNILVYAMSH